MTSSEVRSIPEGATWIRFPRYIGDAVMHFPILRVLREKGVGPLVVWGPALAASLLQDNDMVDAVLMEAGKPGPLDMASTLRRYHAARSIHFPKSLRPALAAWLARVPERIGVSESLAGPFNTHTLPFWKGHGTCLERYMNVLRLRWPEIQQAPMPQYLPSVELELPKEPFVCLLPGASTSTRAWSPDTFARLAEIVAREGYLPVVHGGPKEKELGAHVAGSKGLNVCGLSLQEAAAWFCRASGVVGNNSGLCHLAAACGAPTVGVFRPVDTEMFRPFGPKVSLVFREDLACPPCKLDRCAVDGLPCLNGISSERVWDELLALMSTSVQ